ncbi:MAG TPA: hypothetical protein VGX94_03950 [Terriglobia bacterium]|nr:hypothetical protein [Terriglobia bacterium]
MTRSAKESRAAINTGIQAGAVKADVIAVGKGASAVKFGDSPAVNEELAALAGELRGALDHLSLQPPAREAIEEDLAKLDRAAKERNAEGAKTTLESITGKLKMVGVAAQHAMELAGPIMKIAGLLGVPVPW